MLSVKKISQTDAVFILSQCNFVLLKPHPILPKKSFDNQFISILTNVYNLQN
jgi:hypothetical protein